MDPLSRTVIGMLNSMSVNSYLGIYDYEIMDPFNY